MKKYVYADNAATTQLDKYAFEAMEPLMLLEYGNASQPYSFAKTTKKELTSARERIASCIGAYPEEIFFTSGGTESDNWALKGTVALLEHQAQIVTSSFEHHAILNTCTELQHLGCVIKYVQPDGNGRISIEHLKNTLNDQIDIVSIMLANNEIGTIQPVKEYAKLAHQHGALFHTDAVQAVGHVPIDVHRLDVDLLSASAHKFNGPKGIGFLYIKSGVNIDPLIRGGSQENNMRAGTENVPSIVGMSIALARNCFWLDDNTKRIQKFEALLEKILKANDISYTRNGSGERLPGLLSLSFPEKSGEAILHRLDLKGIEVSTGSACDGEKDKMSHVLEAIGLNPSLGNGTIRVSFGKNNTEEDVLILANALISILKG